MRRKGSVPSRHSHDNLSRHDLNSEITSDLEKAYGVRTAPAVARAVNTIDAWAQLTGRYVIWYSYYYYILYSPNVGSIDYISEQIPEGIPCVETGIRVLFSVSAFVGIRRPDISR